MASKLERISEISKRKPAENKTNFHEELRRIFRELMAADQAHSKPQPGHEITIEAGGYCGKPMVRKACSCGWRGEWYRKGFEEIRNER